MAAFSMLRRGDYLEPTIAFLFLVYGFKRLILLVPAEGLEPPTH